MAKASSRWLPGGTRRRRGLLDRMTANPATNLVLADIALRGGTRLLRLGVEKALLAEKRGEEQAEKVVKGRSLKQIVLGAALSRIATTSVPGAIVVGGGMLAKALYDRRKGSKAEGEAKLDRQAKRGR